MDLATILTEAAWRLVLADNPTVFSIDAFSRAHPDIWADVLAALGQRNNSQFRYIRSGANGSAYRFGADEVVKFTTDDGEVRAMWKVGDGANFIVHVHQVFWIPYPENRHRMIGCIRQEYLQPAATDWKNFGDVATFYFSQVIKYPFDPALVPQFKDWAIKRFSQRAQGSLVEAIDRTTVPRAYPPKVREKPTDHIVVPEIDPDLPWGQFVNNSAKMPTEEMFEWFKGLCKELEKFGISFHDLNGGNIGKRNGVHVAFDLGKSTVKSAPKVPDDLMRKYADQLDETASAIEAMFVLAAGQIPDELQGVPNVWAMVAKKLGHDVDAPLQKLGTGTKGNAYLLSDQTVLKLTTDKQEIVAAKHIQGKTFKRIVTIMAVLDLADGMAAIKMEKLDKPAPDWIEFFKTTEQYFLKQLKVVLPDEVKKFEAAWSQQAQASVVRAEEDPFGDWGDINPGDEVEIKTNVKFPPKLPDPEKFEWLEGLAEELDSVGIEFSDMNPGNIMKRPSGEYVVIDLGVSRVR